MPVNSTHPDYDANLPAWLRARDVIAGEDAVKSTAVRYLPRLDSQTDEEYAAYKERAAFFNATARTAEGYVGLIFRRPPFIKTPEMATPSPRPSLSRDCGDPPQGRGRSMSALGQAFSEFVNDADMLGNPLVGYAKPLPLLPFVFHGPRHSQPGVEKLPLADIITVNLDHYRLDADYKHGVHFTALPTSSPFGVRLRSTRSARHRFASPRRGESGMEEEQFTESFLHRPGSTSR